MEPRIHYAKTSDGVNIAFTTVGKGSPIVVVGDLSDSHVQLVWDAPTGRLVKALTETHTVVKFDPRGFGLSDRDVTDFSIETRLLDVEAVVDRLELTRFALLGLNSGGPLAVVFAVQNPDRVSTLVLNGSPVREAETASRHRALQLPQLILTDWEMFLENLAAVNEGYGREDATTTATLLAAAVERETFVRWGLAIMQDDVTDQLGQVRCPTLVLHYTGVQYLSQETARELASEIPDARLLVIEGNWLDGMQAATDGIFEFLGDEPSHDVRDADRASGVHTILFTDLVRHTHMMSRLGDERGRKVLREHERIVREALAEHSGTEVKTMGDGFMASFESVSRAVECAIALQRAFAKKEGEPLSVRVGLNAGEPIEEDGDLFGATVILASRIAARADGGEILVTDTVRGLCSGKGFLFADRGEFVAKGFEDAIRISEVSWREG